MSQQKKTVREIFYAALDVPSESRSALLDAKCAGDAALRKEVEELLSVHDEPDSVLDSTRIGVGLSESPIDAALTERPGDTIGPYKLLQQIGEGGMGVVYMAEQTEPIDRRVALKIIKPGMDTRHVIARFEVERQALAMMDHPNIARVLDAGTTDTGRPYFVMELVKGTPITEYCDKRHLTPKERLELFLSVCHAVQHAHQKGIIHRDLKPSNVLVAQYDDNAVPKIIDFGIAKAIEHRLTEKTMFTAFGQVMGTIEYMSPEQAQFNQWDIDTRSDIYSLGVLLYELLAGELPFEKDRLRGAALDETFRIIREEEPPRASVRLSTSISQQTIADNRKTEAKKLSALMRGELDWILMKAMDKERTRRYETANQFAEDLDRFINGETVEACPPSPAYQLQKFAQRNKPVLATLTAVALALLFGTGVAISQAIRATEERDRALIAEATAAEEAKRADEQAQRANTEAQRANEEAERANTEAERANTEAENARIEAAITKAVNDFLNNDLLAQANPSITNESEITLREVTERASENIEYRFNDQPLAKAAIHQTLGETYQSIADYEKSEQHLLKALEIHKRELGEEDYRTLNSMFNLAICYTNLRRRQDSEALAHELLEISQRVHKEEKGHTAGQFIWLAENHLGNINKGRGKHSEAADHFRRAIALYSEVHERKPWRLMGNLALSTFGPESEALFREAVELATNEYGEGHIEYSGTKHWFGYRLGTSDEAIKVLNEVLDVNDRVLGPDHPDTRRTRSRLLWIAGEKFRIARDYDKALEQYTEARRARPEDGFGRALGLAYAGKGEWDKAITEYNTVNKPDALVLSLRGSAYVALGEWDKAIEDFTILLNEDPMNETAWLSLMPLLVLAGNETTYLEHIARGVKLIRLNALPAVAEVACKLVFLTPNDVKFDQRQIALLDKAMEQALKEGSAPPEIESRYRATRALVAYRQDDGELAAQHLNASLALNSDELQRAFHLPLLAMVQHQLQRPEDAQKTLQEAKALLDEAPNNPEIAGHSNRLIAMVLLNEAETLINGIER